MAYTYSISTGTTVESLSKTSITDVLSQLPDNTAKLITPRDVRDAIFSTWENSVIRFTKLNSTDYIGIDRADVKDKKIFLGKRQISGNDIMSSFLLNSDTDIFLYNTKLDTNPSQNFKISFLSGTQASLYVEAPYLASTYVTGANPHLSLELVNPATYGTINFQSGSSASLTINNLKFPSTQYVSNLISTPASASQSDATSLFLAVRSGGNVELLTYQSAGNTLGSPGSTTSIFGLPVQVNGYDLEFTDLTPTVATFGGIEIGSTFSNVPLVEMIRSMLYPYLPPLSTIQFNSVDAPLNLGFNNAVERRHTTSTNTIVNFTYTLTKRSDDIIQTDILISNSTGAVPGAPTGLTLSGTGLQTLSVTTVATISSNNISTITGFNPFTFSVTPTDGTQSFTASATLNFVYPYFYGFAATNSSVDATIITDVLPVINLNGGKRVDIKTNQTLALSGTGHLYFIYPQIYGTLSTILDGNNFIEYTHGNFGTWTYSTNTLNSPNSYWSSAQYYVYRKNLPTTIPPSQNYKFNF
jgi:hypothetical protein